MQEPKLLIADDSEPFATALARYLKEQGFAVTIYCGTDITIDGTVAQFAEHEPDALLVGLSFQVERDGGWQVAAQIQQRHAGKGRVIIMSALVGETDRPGYENAAKQYGAAFIPKQRITAELKGLLAQA